MIKLEKLCFAHGRNIAVFDNLTLEIPTNRRVALLGKPGSGKSVLINLLAGLIEPDAGRIERAARLSFPAGYRRGFRIANSARNNVMFAAQIYDADPAEVYHFVRTVTGLGDLLDQPMRELPISAQMSLAYALTYALPFDTYLLDNVLGPSIAGPVSLWRELYDARTQESGAILATRHVRIAEQLCDCAVVLHRSGARFYDDVHEGIAAYTDGAMAAETGFEASAPAQTAADLALEPEGLIDATDRADL